MAEKESAISIEGVVVETLPNAMFRVEIEGKRVVLAYSCGKIRKNKISIISGDRVTMEFSPYDLTKGRIMLRHHPANHHSQSNNSK